MENFSRQSTILIDSADVFSFLNDDYVQKIEEICQRKLNIGFDSIAENTSWLKNTVEVESVFTDVLVSSLEGPGLTKEELEKAREEIKLSYHNRCKINGVIRTPAHQIVEVCSLDFDSSSLKAILNGPDFPENFNKNHQRSSL